MTPGSSQSYRGTLKYSSVYGQCLGRDEYSFQGAHYTIDILAALGIEYYSVLSVISSQLQRRSTTMNAINPWLSFKLPKFQWIIC